MSTLRVESVKIKNIIPHFNADRLEIVELEGNDWHIVVQKDIWKVGDIGILFPVDSVLPSRLESFLFSPDSKIKLDKSRIRAVKIRGYISTGMLVPVSEIQLYINTFLDVLPNTLLATSTIKRIKNGEIGQDIAEALEVTKYEPPTPSFQSNLGRVDRKKGNDNPAFHKYTDIENIKYYPTLFNDEEVVVITEKIHGTSFRAGYVKKEKLSMWDRIKLLFSCNPYIEYEFIYGSRNVQIPKRKDYVGFYDENVYYKIVKKYNLEEILHPGQVVYGEIYGDGIQKGYTYGLKNGEVDFVAYDIQQDGKYLDYYDFEKVAHNLSLPTVPELSIGYYDLDDIKRLSEGPSILSPSQPIREGVVVKPIKERLGPTGRAILKSLNPEYLVLKNSDFH